LSGGESGWTNPLGFDKFVWNEFGQPKGWPRSAPARRGEAQDEPNNPTLSARYTNKPLIPLAFS